MIFKYFKTKLKRRQLFLNALEENVNIDKEFQDVQSRLGIVMAMPQFDVLVEYFEAQIESLRDILELDFDNKDNTSRAKIEVYRDLIALFNDAKEKQLLEDSKPLES